MTVKGNGVIAQLKRLLAKPPEETVRAVLSTCESFPMVLGKWSRESLKPELAEEIFETVTENAAVAPGTSCMFTLLDKDDKPAAQRKLDPMATAAADDGDAAAFAPRGDNMAQAVNAQRHLEAMQRLSFQQIAQTNETLRLIVKDMAAQITDERKARVEAQRRADALADSLARMEVAEPDQVAESQERVLQLLQPLLPAIAARILQLPASAPQSPPTTK